VFGFPCNQFGAQESGTNKEIKSFCSLKYKITFPMFSKIEVNGKNTHPVYRFLRSNSSLNNGDGTINPIKWNFNSFLVNGDGQVLKWFASGEKPANIEKEFLPLLS
jgi:glutathione peroxidase